jgi:uncharacterized membrane protein
MESKTDRDADVRKWCGVPYRWNWRKAFADVWNPAEPRVFPPKQFGIGWGLNFHALLERLGLGKKR